MRGRSAGGPESRRGAPVPAAAAEATPPTPLWRCCVKLKGNVVPLKWPQDAGSYGSYRRWWWRTHLSLPEAVTHGAIITTFQISEQRRCLVSKARSDQMVSGAALRLRAPPLCARTADALPSTELLLCSIVFKYVGPPQPLLSFPSSCSRLFDNRGKWVLKRQLIASQAPENAAPSGVELRRDWRSWLHYPLIVPQR